MSVVSRTFALIKPDAMQKGCWGEILFRIQSARFQLFALRSLTLSRELLEAFYQEHRSRPFFGPMVSRMEGQMAIALGLEAPQAVERFRQLIGATHPVEAFPGTLRHDYGENLDANAIHGSDSEASALRELRLFFGELA